MNHPEPPHLFIAKAIVEDAKASSSDTEPKLYAKVMPSLFVDPTTNQPGLRGLRVAVEQLIEEVDDKALNTKLQKFAQQLEAADATPEASLEEAVTSSCSPGGSVADGPEAENEPESEGPARRQLNKRNVIVMSDDEDEEVEPAKSAKDEVPEESQAVEQEEPAPKRRGQKARPAPKEPEEEPEEESEEESEEEPEEPVAEKVLVTEKELSKMKVVELREELKKRGADQKGLKAVLVTRLCELMNAE